MEAIRAATIEFLILHQKCLVDQVDGLLGDVAGAAVGDRPPLVDALFLKWYRQFGVTTAFHDRTGAMARLAQAVPAAHPEDVLLAVVRAEMRGFAEADAKRALEKQFGIVRPRGRSLGDQASSPYTAMSPPAAPTVTTPVSDHGQQRKLTPPNRSGSVDGGGVARALAAVDPLAEEIRDWIVAVFGSSSVLAPYVAAVKASAHVADALRDGVVLTLLLHKLLLDSTSPSPAASSDNDDSALKKRIPKRTDGFFKRDNVAKCLMDIAASFPHVSDTQMIDAADVCDGRNDRAVITFLLNLAKAAVRRGYAGPVPIIIQYDAEIEAQKISEADVEAAVATLLVDEREGRSDEYGTKEPVAPPQPPPPTSPTETMFVAAGGSSKKVEPPRTRPIAVLSLSPGLHEPTKPTDRLVSKQSVAQAVASLKASEPPPSVHDASSAGAGGYGGGGRYDARKGDVVDERVGCIFNQTLRSNPRVQTRLKRLAHEGAYVVYHRITGRRTVVHIRAIQSTLMIRVGGGWDAFEDWLDRHVSIDLV